MPPSDRWPVGLVAGVARALAAFAAAVRGRSSSRRWRARSACRAVCALPRLRAAGAPVVWLAGRGGEGCFVLQRPRMGTGTRLPALRSPPDGGDSAQTARKSQGGRFHPRLYTKFCVQKIPGQKILAGDGGERLPQMPSNCARPDQRRAKRDSQSQTASRLAGNGLSDVVALSVRPVGV